MYAPLAWSLYMTMSCHNFKTLELPDCKTNNLFKKHGIQKHIVWWTEETQLKAIRQNNIIKHTCKFKFIID